MEAKFTCFTCNKADKGHSLLSFEPNEVKTTRNNRHYVSKKCNCGRLMTALVSQKSNATETKDV